MFEAGQFIMYGCTGVCKVDAIERLKIPGTEATKLYYALEPVYNKRSKVYIPVDNEKVVMRPVITRNEAENLLHDIPHMEIIQTRSEKEREKIYKDTVHSCDARQWSRILKTLYFRKDYRQSKGKKITSHDAKYIHLAEDILLGELSFVFGVPIRDVRGTITEKVKNQNVDESVTAIAEL